LTRWDKGTNDKKNQALENLEIRPTSTTSLQHAS
jgi:hypothetical protein